MDLPKELQDEIWEYCRINKISNIDEFTVKMITQGFTVEKFGATPYIKEPETIIKTVEKIVEVPVEKEVYITDSSEVEKLLEKITKLQAEYDSSASKELELESEITRLKGELASQVAKENNDIYNEPRKGIHGSNTMDIYGK